MKSSRRGFLVGLASIIVASQSITRILPTSVTDSLYTYLIRRAKETSAPSGLELTEVAEGWEARKAASDALGNYLIEKMEREI